MIRDVKILILVLCFAPVAYHAEGQDTEYLSFYYNPVRSNPAMTGSEGVGKLRMVYRDYYPGRGLDLFSIDCSYDTYIDRIHGGLGFFVSENMPGTVLNDLRAGAGYSYHLRASRDLYVNAGFMASVIYRGLNARGIILPEQIDPLQGIVFPASEIISSGAHTSFDAGVGFLFSYMNYHAGISVSHLFKPALGNNGVDESRLDRRYSFHGSAVFLQGAGDISLIPGFLFNIQGNSTTGAAGLSCLYKNFTANIMPFVNTGQGLIFVQSGIGFIKGQVEIGYNYNFVPVAGSGLQPFTLSNQVYVSIGLNNVEKRDIIKAIIYPKM